ncbi:NAD-dependent epimerase/dehydratase family protein [Patescibacteria group bacterium]|nr:NAD-dependent epimerase/dehydratase family protein [Patescibacteria group bacterium]MBU4023308.1 NAD-dependent epimerase/dehydratase family protein [Patescibacteria group bacterium]MBU4078473.1 NAD-dependent epimerase/dehydratase family protein [Patescibacteria group bacterium]
MDLNKKKILITGGAGFIGSNLVMTIQEKYPEAEIFVIDNFSSGHFQNLSGFKGDIVAANILDIDLEKDFLDLDIIFHQAAITDTIISRDEERKVIYENIESFRRILDYALSHNTHLVYASSSGVYGNSPAPMKVGEGELPLNAYSFSKLIIDNIARKYFNLFGEKKLVGLRYFIVYGPNEKYKVTETKGSLIWKFYSEMKKGKRPMLFDGGKQKRDFVYVKDVVNSNLLALDAKRNGIFNIGTGKAIIFNEVINILNKFIGTNLEPEYQINSFKDSYQYYTEADIVSTKKYLNWEPEYTLEQGIRDYLKS